MRVKLLPIALVMLGLALVSPADGQIRHDSAAPIDVRSANLDVQDKANRAILSGGVVVTQAELTIRADRVTVSYTGEIVDGNPSISRMDAAGGVTITQPDKSARAQYAVYDLNQRIITLIGDVELKRGSDVLRGPRLVMSLDSNRATLGGTRTSNGQVTGRFSPPKRSAAPAPAPAPSDAPQP